VFGCLQPRCIRRRKKRKLKNARPKNGLSLDSSESEILSSSGDDNGDSTSMCSYASSLEDVEVSLACQ